MERRRDSPLPLVLALLAPESRTGVHVCGFGVVNLDGLNPAGLALGAQSQALTHAHNIHRFCEKSDIKQEALKKQDLGENMYR